MLKYAFFIILTVGFLSFSQSKTDHYTRLTNQLKEISSTHKSNTKLFSIGKNDQGINILGLSIFPKIKSRSPLPEAIVVAIHHGNEVGSADVAMTLIKNLLAEQAKGKKAQNKIIHVVPVLNISGFNIRKRQEYSSRLKKWIDPNRDYPDACEPRKASFVLRSTSLIANFIKSRKRISAAVSIHGYIGTLTFPWGNPVYNTHTKDHETYIKLSEYSVKANGYKVGTHADVIYPAIGAFEDWAYAQYGIWTTLLEIDHKYNRVNDANSLVRFLFAAPNFRSRRKMKISPKDCKVARSRSHRSRP